MLIIIYNTTNNNVTCVPGLVGDGGGVQHGIIL